MRETLYAMDFPEISAIIKTSIVYCKADFPRQQERRMTMKQSTVSMRIRIENLCIGIIFLFSLMLFALSFFHRSSAEAAVLVSTEMGWMVQRAVSVLLFCLVSQLKKRKRAAYDITLLLLLLSLLRGVRHLF